jgi:lysophospholipase L1-like esterase
VRARLVLVSAALAGVAAGLFPAAASPTATTLRIWPLGDSITLGTSAPQNSPGGYRTALDQILSQAGMGHRFVGMDRDNSSPTLDVNDEGRHDGHGGYRVDQVRRDLDGLAHAWSDLGGRWLTRAGAAQAINPDVVLIHLGTNDILQRWDTHRYRTRDGRVNLSVLEQRQTFVIDLTARLSDLLLRIHVLRPRAVIVVATAVPIDVAGYAETVADYAASVRVLVERLSAHRVPVVLADAYSAFVADAPPGGHVAPGLLSNDAVHPTAAGYAVLARTFAAVLEGRNLPVPASRGKRP